MGVEPVWMLKPLSYKLNQFFFLLIHEEVEKNCSLALGRQHTILYNSRKIQNSLDVTSGASTVGGIFIIQNIHACNDVTENCTWKEI